MNYETLFCLILILLVIISFGIHYQRNKNKKPNIKYIIIEKKEPLVPPGKGFAEYIPPARKCNPEDGCHVGSYVDFSTKNL